METHWIRCIIAKGKTIIYVGADYMGYMTIIHFTQKIGSSKSFLLYAYSYAQYHMIGVTVCLYGFTVIM